MGKLVKKAELVALGTFGIIFLCSNHLPGLLSSLDATTSPQTYTATAYEAVDTYTPPVVVSPSPSATITVTAASSTSGTASTDSQTATSGNTATEPSSDTSVEQNAAVDPTNTTNSPASSQ